MQVTLKGPVKPKTYDWKVTDFIAGGVKNLKNWGDKIISWRNHISARKLCLKWMSSGWRRIKINRRSCSKYQNLFLNLQKVQVTKLHCRFCFNWHKWHQAYHLKRICWKANWFKWLKPSKAWSDTKFQLFQQQFKSCARLTKRLSWKFHVQLTSKSLKISCSNTKGTGKHSCTPSKIKFD